MALKEHHLLVTYCQFSNKGEARYPLIRRSLQAFSKGHWRGDGPTDGGWPKARDSADTPPPNEPQSVGGGRSRGRARRPQAVPPSLLQLPHPKLKAVRGSQPQGSAPIQSVHADEGLAMRTFPRHPSKGRSAPRRLLQLRPSGGRKR